MVPKLLRKIIFYFKRKYLLYKTDKAYYKEKERIRNQYNDTIDRLFEEYMPSDLSKEVARGREQMERFGEEIDQARKIREQQLLTVRNDYATKRHSILNSTSP